jgi:hypothetical protein
MTDDCSYWWIVSNYIADIDPSNSAIDVFCLTAGHYAENGVISDNIIKSNGSADVCVGFASAGNIRNIIINNNMFGCASIGDSSGGETSNILIEGNIIRDGFAYGLSIGPYAKYVNIIGNSISGHQYAGIKVATNNVAIRDNRIFNNGQKAGTADSNRPGIYVNDSKDNCMITGNSIFDDQGASHTQSWPVLIDAFGTGHVITDNYFAGHETSDIPMINGTVAIKDHNIGWVRENGGAAASISDGSYVNHGLYTAPTYANLTGTVAGDIIGIYDFSTTQIHISVKKHDGTPGTSQTVYWRANV